MSGFNVFKRRFYNYIDNKLNKKSEKFQVVHLKSCLDEEPYSVVEAFNLEKETVAEIFEEL